MSGRPSAEVVRAIAMMREAREKGIKMSAYAAAKAVNISLSTIYRSALYKADKAEQEQSNPNPNHKEPA